MIIKNELQAAASRLAISAVSNAGGEGKTTIAVVLEAALDLLGRPPQLVDIDQGMGSLAFQREDAKSLDWGMSEIKADAVFARLQDDDVIFDFGANRWLQAPPLSGSTER
jgi:cellulose biosynthesis protein BcsQ